jgi:hypothetical protein
LSPFHPCSVYTRFTCTALVVVNPGLASRTHPACAVVLARCAVMCKRLTRNPNILRGCCAGLGTLLWRYGWLREPCYKRVNHIERSTCVYITRYIKTCQY